MHGTVDMHDLKKWSQSQSDHQFREYAHQIEDDRLKVIGANQSGAFFRHTPCHYVSGPLVAYQLYLLSVQTQRDELRIMSVICNFLRLHSMWHKTDGCYETDNESNVGWWQISYKGKIVETKRIARYWVFISQVIIFRFRQFFAVLNGKGL